MSSVLCIVKFLNLFQIDRLKNGRSLLLWPEFLREIEHLFLCLLAINVFFFCDSPCNKKLHFSTEKGHRFISSQTDPQMVQNHWFGVALNKGSLIFHISALQTFTGCHHGILQPPVPQVLGWRVLQIKKGRKFPQEIFPFPPCLSSLNLEMSVFSSWASKCGCDFTALTLGSLVQTGTDLSYSTFPLSPFLCIQSSCF